MGSYSRWALTQGGLLLKVGSYSRLLYARESLKDTFMSLRTLPTLSMRITLTIRRTAGEKCEVDSGRLSSTMMSTTETSRINRSNRFHLLRK